MSFARVRCTARIIGPVGVIAAVAAVALLLYLPRHAAAEDDPGTRTFTVTAKRYRFEPTRIEVLQDELVKIELRTEDIAHSWTVDAYRIAKRVGPGGPVTLEFRADKAGTFPIYCNLQTEEGCRQMKGELVVKPRAR